MAGKIDQYMRSSNTLRFKNIDLTQMENIEVRLEQESLRRKLHFTIHDTNRLTFSVDRDTASLLDVSKSVYVQVLMTFAGGQTGKTKKLQFLVSETIGGEPYGN